MASDTISGPMPSPLTTAILYSMGLCLSLLERLEQAARLDDVLDKRRNAAACQLALGNVGDHAGVEVYFYLVACINAVRRCLALEGSADRC